MSTLLLDTNVWLWMAAGSDRITPTARALIEDADTELVLSAVSVWELSIKWALGKLPLPVSPEEFVQTTTAQGGMRRLAIEFDHVIKVASLPPIHSDPFDRLLVAQAMCTGLPLLTGARTIGRYGIATVDATAS